MSWELLQLTDKKQINRTNNLPRFIHHKIQYRASHMRTYLIADIHVHDTEKYKSYVELVPRMIEKHGGVYRVRGGAIETREGDWQPQRLVVLEFQSREDAVAFLEDPEYQPIAAIRHAAATTRLILAEAYQ